MSYIVALTAGITLNETDTVASVLQNVSMIVSTEKGTVPMDRDLGISMAWLDKPLPIAKVMGIAEIREAVERYEPRARVVGISFEKSEDGRLIPKVEVEINE